MAMKLGLLMLLICSVQVKGNCPDEDNDDGGLPQPSTTSQAYHQQDTTTATTTSGSGYYEEDNTFVKEDPSSIPVTKLHQRILSTTSDTHYQTQSEGLLSTTTGLQPTTKPSTTLLSSTSTNTYMLPTTYSEVQLTTQPSTPLSSTSLSVPDVTYVVQATPTPLSQYIVNAAVNSPPECECIVLKDCKAWYDYGYNYSGIFTVNPDNGEPFRVYCDMTTDGGGWTVFQRRQDGSVYFYLGWDQYKQGFGSLTGEYWLGLDKIHRLTKSGESQLRVDLGDFENNVRYAKYSSFKIGNETTKYTMNISGYSGNAGDSMSAHSNMKFTTKDQDNDIAESGNCAHMNSGAWWYGFCHISNLNGLYLRGSHSHYANGVEWYTWTKHRYSLRFTEMKTKYINEVQ